MTVTLPIVLWILEDLTMVLGFCTILYHVIAHRIVMREQLKSIRAMVEGVANELLQQRREK